LAEFVFHVAKRGKEAELRGERKRKKLYKRRSGKKNPQALQPVERKFLNEDPGNA
jgi:hypothetical protein